MAYVDDFKEAIIRTRRLQLAQPVDLCEMHTRIMNDKRIRHLGGIIRPVLDLNSGYEQLVGKRLVRTVLIFTESSDQLSRATDRVPGLPASPGYVQ